MTKLNYIMPKGISPEISSLGETKQGNKTRKSSFMSTYCWTSCIGVSHMCCFIDA